MRRLWGVLALSEWRHCFYDDDDRNDEFVIIHSALEALPLACVCWHNSTMNPKLKFCWNWYHHEDCVSGWKEIKRNIRSKKKMNLFYRDTMIHINIGDWCQCHKQWRKAILGGKKKSLDFTKSFWWFWGELFGSFTLKLSLVFGNLIFFEKILKLNSNWL